MSATTDTPLIPLRPEVLATPLAVHGGPQGSRDERFPLRLDFSASVNAWGPAPALLAAVRSADIAEYPDPEALAARRAVAMHWGCAPEEVAVGAGASELLQSIALAYLRVGDRVLIPSPTFGEYARAAALMGAEVVEFPASPPVWRLDAGELADAIGRLQPRVVFLCTPNNPTGQALTGVEVGVVADAAAELGTLVVLDQSYDAFTASPLGTPPIPGHPALLSLRSLTKDHALAGLRVALAVGPAPIIEGLERARAPWSASAMAQAAVIAALSPAGDVHLAGTLPRLREERARIEGALAGLGVPTVPTTTHYLLGEVGDAGGVATRLRREYGIGVRNCASFGLPAHIRVAARRPEENDELLDALEGVCSN